MAGGVDGDERGQAVDRDDCHDPIVLRINHGDWARLGIDDVDFVAKGIGGQIRRLDSDLKGPVLAEINEVEDRDRVGAAVADVGELSITCGYVWETAAAAAREPQKGRADDCSYGLQEGGSQGCWH